MIDPKNPIRSRKKRYKNEKERREVRGSHFHCCRVSYGV